MTTIIRWIKFLLKAWGLYQEEIIKPGQEAVEAQVQQQIGEIDHETAEQTAMVDNTPDSGLPEQLDSVFDAAAAHNREH